MPIPATRAVPTLSRSPSHNGIGAVRPAVLGLARLLGVSISAVAAAPLAATFEHGDGDDPDDLGTPLWVLYVASAILVLLGGAFAGLTIALMGQDSIYLQVISSDKDEPQHNNARRVYKLLESGKHWVLVTLLLSNVIVNESLPVVLDRCLGGGVAAVVGSTALIVIFGEVVPQSVCVRYGLQIGGYMSKPVLALMWLTAPLSWPTAKLLDWILGEDHGTVYKKSGLKTLVTLHRSLGVASERLNRDEVTIISAVLDLKEKPVAAVMTPMNDVFVMSEDTVLDEPTMDRILSAGYSRIPIHEAGNPTNFLGMLLVKILITYDPEDCMHVKDFPLATLPETRPETSCLDIVNYFQEGKSHMVLVSDSPGNPYGALGVVTLEDVIEELIGEEIIDESDVYVDVHKAIRRLHPAPNAQVYRRHSMTASKPVDNTKAEENVNGLASPRPAPADVAGTSKSDASQLSASPRATFLLRRSSAGADGKMVQSAVPVRANIDDIREHLRHLGPSNPANNPKNTRLTSVTIKPGHGAVGSQRSALSEVTSGTPNIEVHQPTDGYEGGDDETTSLLRAAPANNRSVHRVSSKDGVQALRQSYGAVSATEAQQRVLGASPPGFTEAQRNQAAQTPKLTTTDEGKTTVNPKAPSSEGSGGGSPTSDDRGSRPNTPLLKRSTVRSGSITENIFESRGFRKVVLETASSNDGEDEDGSGAGLGGVGGGLNGGSISEPNLLGGRGSSSLSKSVSDVDEETDDEGARSAADRGTSPGGQSGASNNDGGKKKNRRKKRKGRS